MTKFNFFSLLILALFYNTTNIFSQNEVISIDIQKYDYLKSESYKIKTIEIKGNKRTKTVSYTHLTLPTILRV